MLEWIGIIMFGPKPKTTTACTLKVKNSYDLKCPELVPFLSYEKVTNVMNAKAILLQPAENDF